MDTNDSLRVASLWHSMHAISQQLSPTVGCLGIELLEADTFDLHCFQSLTGGYLNPFIYLYIYLFTSILGTRLEREMLYNLPRYQFLSYLVIDKPAILCLIVNFFCVGIWTPLFLI
jgi:hypothetical protein